jgi:hypothetical protein
MKKTSRRGAKAQRGRRREEEEKINIPQSFLNSQGNRLSPVLICFTVPDI